VSLLSRKRTRAGRVPWSLMMAARLLSSAHNTRSWLTSFNAEEDEEDDISTRKMKRMKEEDERTE